MSNKYRKKPVVIEAHQWFKNGDHPFDYDADKAYLSKDVEGQIVRRFNHPEKPGADYCKCGKPYHRHGWIDTLEGGHIVCPGDWIITGIEGEHYPCKPDIFAKTYEKVEEG